MTDKKSLNSVQIQNFDEKIKKLLSNNSVDPQTKNLLLSFLDFYRKNGHLSTAQFKCYEKIESRFSPGAQEEHDKWVKTFDKEKRENMRIAAQYYKLYSTYFVSLSRNVLENEDFVPTQKAYKAMVENKYAQKIIKNTKAPPRYGQDGNTLVQLRKNAVGIPRNVERESICVILKINSSPVSSCANGSKKYLVMPFGHSVPFEVEERYLKKYKEGTKDNES